MILNSDKGVEPTPIEMETRERILVTAERLFREIGYQKTTVGDIAKALRMSPANVYRFFESKKAIHEGVARHLMGEVEAAALAIANKSASPLARLREILSTVHHMNADRYVCDAKLHEMVSVAMEESWDVCQAHMLNIASIIGAVIGDGVTTGDFHSDDVETAAKCVCNAMMRFFHPQMIAECAGKPGVALEPFIDFVLASLTRSPR